VLRGSCVSRGRIAPAAIDRGSQSKLRRAPAGLHFGKRRVGNDSLTIEPRRFDPALAGPVAPRAEASLTVPPCPAWRRQWLLRGTGLAILRRGG